MAGRDACPTKGLRRITSHSSIHLHPADGGTSPPVYAKASPRQAGGHGPPAGGCPYMGEINSVPNHCAQKANLFLHEAIQI